MIKSLNNPLPRLFASALIGLTLGLVCACDDDGGGGDPASGINGAGGKADEAQGPCYEGYDPKAPCQYDMECDDRGDCCPDLVDVCGSGEAQEFPGVPPSDDGSSSSGDETEAELYGIVSIVPCSEITVQPEPVEFVSAVVNGPIDVTVLYPACGEGHEFVACYNQLPSYGVDEYAVDLTVYPGDGPCDGEREARVLIHPAALFEDYLAETGTETDSIRARLWRFGWLDIDA